MMDVVEGDSADPSVETAFKEALPRDYTGGVSYSPPSYSQMRMLTGIVYKD